MSYGDHPPLPPDSWDVFPDWPPYDQPLPEPCPPTTFDDVQRQVTVGEIVHIGSCVEPLLLEDLIPITDCRCSPCVQAQYRRRDDPQKGMVTLHVINGRLMTWRLTPNYYVPVMRPTVWHRYMVADMMSFARHCRRTGEAPGQLRRVVQSARDHNHAAMRLSRTLRQTSLFEVPA